MSRLRKKAERKLTASGRRIEDQRREIRAVWAPPDLVAQIDLCAHARGWTRAAYVLYAAKELVRSDLGNANGSSIGAAPMAAHGS